MAAQASDAPRIRVAAVIPCDGRLVLVRHRKGAREYHLLPGGGVRRGESLADALAREVREETGLSVQPARLLYVSDGIDPAGDRHVLHVTFLAEVAGGRLQPPDDPRVASVDLMDASELANADLRPPIAAVLLEDWERGFERETAYLGPLWAPE